MEYNAVFLLVVIVPIFRKDEERDLVLSKAKELACELEEKGISVKIDDEESQTPGYKFNKWEIKGIPIRVELGPRDLKNSQVVLCGRLDEKKSSIPIASFSLEIETRLNDMQKKLFDRASERMQSMSHEAEKLETFGSELSSNNGFYYVGWCGSEKCEADLKKYKRVYVNQKTNNVYNYTAAKAGNHRA